MTMRKIFLVLLLSTISKKGISQNIDISPNSNIEIGGINKLFTSPESYSFHRVNFLPMNLYTGKIDINIPIYTIKSGDLEIPIALKYDMHANKVDSKASNVGWGWSLHSGGSIMRVIRDIDDHAFDYVIEEVLCRNIGNCDELGTEITGSKLIRKGYLRQVKDALSLKLGVKDLSFFTSNLNDDALPDLFLVNAPGLSTKFYLERISENYLPYSEYKAVNIGNPQIKIGNTIFDSFDTEPIKNFAGFDYQYAAPYLGEYIYMIGNKDGINIDNPLYHIRGYDTYPGLIRYYNKDYNNFYITNDKGTKYYFNTYDIYESVSPFLHKENPYYGLPDYGFPNLNHFAKSYKIQKSTWHLDKIIDTKNNQIKYTYEPVYTFDYDKIENISGTISMFEPNDINKFSHFLDTGVYNNYILGDEKKSDIYSSYKRYTSKLYDIKKEYFIDYGIVSTLSKITQQQLLKKINWNEGEAEFVYGYKRIDNVNIPGLSEIIIKDKEGNIIENYNLEYSYFKSKEDKYTNGSLDNRLYRLKLDKVTKLDLKNNQIYKYHLEYNNPDDTPRLYSFDKDYLGYYNKSNNMIKAENSIDYASSHNHIVFRTKFMFMPNKGRFSIIPFQNDKLLNKAIKITGENDTNPNHNSLNGLLKKIIYPNGGSIEIEYENNVFNFEGIDILSGGGRVKSQIINDAKGSKLVKKYEYNHINGKSSGGIANFPKVADILRWDSKNKHLAFKTYNYNNANIELTQGAYIGYSRVLEKIEGKGYIEYNYSSFDEYPNDYESPSNSFFSKHSFYPGKGFTDHDNRRGALIKKIFFDTNNEKIMEEIYQYNNYKIISSKLNSFKISTPIYDSYNGFLDYSEYHSIKIANSVNLPSSKESIYYNNNEIIKKQNYYFFNDANYITKKKEILSNKETLETTYQYAHEKGNNYLINKNIVGIPLETAVTQDGKIISKKETIYPTSQAEANTKTQGLPLPVSSLSYDLENPTKTNQDITYTQYDNKGNLLEYKLNGIIPVVIIWGYHQTLPIAKIEGATYDQVKNLVSDIISKSNEDKDEVSEKDLITALDNFRNKEELKNFQITTYTHNPLIGVTSITPPSGIREIYKYDDANRLKQVLDIHGNILKEYQYNYRQP